MSKRSGLTGTGPTPNTPGSKAGNNPSSNSFGNISGTGGGEEPYKPTGANISDTETYQRKTFPDRADVDYRTADMTFLHITTEELGTLGALGGVGSVALSCAFFFAEQAYSTEQSLAYAGLAGFSIVAIVVYILFFGLVARVRRRSGLKPWRLFSG